MDACGRGLGGEGWHGSSLVAPVRGQRADTSACEPGASAGEHVCECAVLAARCPDAAGQAAWHRPSSDPGAEPCTRRRPPGTLGTADDTVPPALRPPGLLSWPQQVTAQGCAVTWAQTQTPAAPYLYLSGKSHRRNTEVSCAPPAGRSEARPGEGGTVWGAVWAQARGGQGRRTPTWHRAEPPARLRAVRGWAGSPLCPPPRPRCQCLGRARAWGGAAPPADADSAECASWVWGA